MAAQAPAIPAHIEKELRHDIAQMDDDPLAFARYIYGWGDGDLVDSGGPRKWQQQILTDIRDHLKDAKSRFRPLRIAVSSGHGVGKSSLVGFILHWALSTCDQARATVTATTGTQLATKTVPEVTKWFKLGLNHHWFLLQATSITAADERHYRTWRADFVPWSVEKSEAFAGLHNKRKRIVVIYDEASGIDRKIWEVTEGALTDEWTEIIWIAFGNPTRRDGRFFECFHKDRALWHHYQIDSREVEGTNKQQIQEWIDSYGEDSDFVRVRVRGVFPRAATTQLISADIVATCQNYKAQGFELQPKVMAVDVARYGDDRSTIVTRQGRKYSILDKLVGKSTVEVGKHVIERLEEEKPDFLVIDSDGLGAGTFDYIAALGWGDRVQMVEFHGNEAPVDGRKYFNRRAEIWCDLRDALKAGAELPRDPEVEADLTGPEYGFSASQQLQLEKKEHMKARGVQSPDIGDGFAMTHAVKPGLKKEEKKEKRYVTHGGVGRAGGWMG